MTAVAMFSINVLDLEGKDAHSDSGEYQTLMSEPFCKDTDLYPGTKLYENFGCALGNNFEEPGSLSEELTRLSIKYPNFILEYCTIGDTIADKYMHIDHYHKGKVISHTMHAPLVSAKDFDSI